MLATECARAFAFALPVTRYIASTGSFLEGTKAAADLVCRLRLVRRALF